MDHYRRFISSLTLIIICVIVVWVDIACGIGGIPGIITDPPVDSTTCYGGIATFTCGSDRGSDIAHIQWTIDGEDVNDINTIERGISTHTNITDGYAATTLTIVGLHDNHDIAIGCQMIVTSPVVDSDNEAATFTVTDIPPVTNLTIEFTGATMITTWQAPTVLPVDYHYQINISYGSVLITNTTVDPVYIMNITRCSTNYTVSVSVVDIGYTQLHSEYTTNTTEYDVYEDAVTYPDIQLFQDNITVVFINNIMTSITVVCEIHNLECPDRSYQFIEYVQSTLPSGITFNETVDRVVDSCKDNGNYTLGPFDKRFIGNMTVVPMNTTEPVTNMSQITISTFHVQNFSLDVLSNTTLNLTCFFALNSSADGCNVTFNSINQSVLVSVFILKDNTIAVTNYTGIPEGDSVVNVYDVVEGVNSDYPAIEDREYNITYFNLEFNSVSSSETTTSGGIVSSPITSSSSTATSTVTPSVTSVTMDTSVATNNAPVIIIATAAGGVVPIIIVAIAIVVMIVTMKTSRKRKQVTLTQERTLVRLNIAEPHDYTNAEELMKPAVEGIYHEHRSNFLPPNNNSHSNNTSRSPPPTYENANNLFARKECNSEALDDDNVSVAIEDCVVESPVGVESTTDHTNGHLVMTSGPPPLPLKTTSFIKVPAGAKLDKSQYVAVGFTPNIEVDGVCTRPQPAMSQPQLQYATVQIQSSIVISMPSCPHNEKSQVERNVDIHHVPDSTVTEVDEHSALSKWNKSTFNSASEATHHTLISAVQPSPCDTIQETSIPTESADIDEEHTCFVGYSVQEHYCNEEAFAVSDPASKSQIIVPSWNDIFSELVCSLENFIHYELEEVNLGNESKHDDCNLEIYGISYAIIWVKEELEFDFLNYDATTLVDIGHWLKKIYTCASVVCNGSTYLPDVWLKRKIGLMCKSIDYGGRSVEGTCEICTAGYNWKEKFQEKLPA